jgi:hypothetical protein
VWRAFIDSERFIMKTIRHSFSSSAAALIVSAMTAVTGLSGCGGGGASKTESAAEHDGVAAGESAASSATDKATSEAPAVESAIQSASAPAELVSRSDTSDAAMDTYLDGVKQGKLDIALTVLHPDSPGANALNKMMVGWEKAKADGAPVEMAIALIGGEVDALTYEKISDDGSFATFRFTSPTKENSWEIEAIKTPDGWRIKPPDSGLPTG